MNQKIIDCPTRADLLEFLSTEVEDQGSTTEAHLSDCTECQQRLETLSASAEVWDEARASLTPMNGEFLATREFPQPGNSNADDAIEGLGPIDESAYLKILGPTDDPNMMGRIGSYEVVGVVGRGGMGVVFKAYDAPLNRFVAIKMLLPHLAVSATARQRFAREGQAAAAVIDDHVTPIYNVAQWKEIPYLVTQYCGGVTLQKRIADRGQLTIKEVLRIGLQTAQGLAAAHAQGLVHRDVKPSNILLDGEVERAMLTDFGLARAVDDASITRTGVITGTPQYMSPEQARGESIDARSDLFSLGSTLYAMCAGRPPFRSESAYGVMHRITHEEPTPIRAVNSDVPPWMATIIERLMSKKAEDRFESAEEVAQLLEGCLAHVQQPTTTKLPETLASMGAGRDGSSSWGKWLAMASFAFLFALGGILLVFELNKGKLVIECAADNVPIRITQGDEEIQKLTVSKEGATVKVAAGKYIVEIDGDSDNVVVDNGVATLSRGGVETVTISLRGADDSVAGGWVPPANPDLKEILNGAKEDTRSGNYQIALAKHLWYHENAHLIEPNRNSRLSSAMSNWLELGEEYPPALAKMREVRDATEAKIRGRDDDKIDFESFQVFQAFNRTLREPRRTAELFKWIDDTDSKYAGRVYPVAEEALLKQREYKTCSKYIDPVYDVKKICFSYEDNSNRASKSEYKSLGDYAERAFVKDSATLVEILINVDREPEAQKAAASLREHVKEKEFYAQLDNAINAAMVKQPPLESAEAEVETVKDHSKATADSDVEQWTPPEKNPDPSEIRQQAKRDADAGNYELALQKHLWYHENSKQTPGEGGVRLSYALTDWLELGEKYPPALAMMREVCDALEAKIRDEDRVRVKFEDFHDFVAFNRTLRQEQRIAKLFKWLDGYSAEDAKRMYPIAEAALIKQKEYKICGKYIEPIKDVRKIFESYELHLEMSERIGERHLEHTRKTFVADGATLVNILVKNDRKAEAEATAASLREFAEGKEVAAELNEALNAAMEKQSPPESSESNAENKAGSDGEQWTPPEDPHPGKILDEASEDRQSGDYPRALAKHLWYHENANQIQPGLNCVRWSHAMSDWFELGEIYPPAKAKMLELRDALELKIRDENRVRVRFEDFSDFAAFNRTLKQEQRTAQLFKWLDGHNAEDAKRVYHTAQAALVKQEEYNICGKYTAPIFEAEIICEFYESKLKSYESESEISERFGEKHLDHVRKEAVTYGANIVKILVENDRAAEAEAAAASLRKSAKGSDIAAELDAALSSIGTLTAPNNGPNPRPVGDKVDFKINSVKLSKYDGATIAALGKPPYKVPAIARTLVLTYTTKGTKFYEVPTVRLKNGTLVSAIVLSKPPKAGIQSDVSSESSVTHEVWYPVEESLPLNAIFPCVVEIGVGDGKNRKTIKVENVSP